jgi:hypothetical protein
MRGPFHGFLLVRDGRLCTWSTSIGEPRSSRMSGLNRHAEELCRRAERLTRQCEQVELPDSLVWYLNDTLN